jgi:hypothetical protein
VTAVLEAPTTDAQQAAAADVDDVRVDLIIQAAGELAGRSVLIVGSERLWRSVGKLGAERLGLVDVSPAPLGARTHPGPFPALTFLDRYDVVVVPAAFDGGGDPLPALARACAVANERVVAWLPRARKKWLGKPTDPLAPSHDPARIKSLLLMCGAGSVAESRADGGFIVTAKMS